MILPLPYRDLSQWEGVPRHKLPADVQLARQARRIVGTYKRHQAKIDRLRNQVRDRDARIAALEELLAEARDTPCKCA